MTDTSVTYDDTTALVVVDVQHDFADPEGSLYVAGGEQIVPVVNQAIAAARRGGAAVVYTQDWHPPSTPHFDTDGGTWPVHCVKDTWGAAFHDDLEVADDAPVVRKGTGGWDGYSGFTIRDPESDEERPTELEGMLRERDISRVVVCGLAQDVCVQATALDAVRLGFTTTVLADATRPVNLAPDDGEQALAAMREAGVTIA